MVKDILLDYRCSAKEGFRNYMRSGGWWTIGYMLIFPVPTLGVKGLELGVMESQMLLVTWIILISAVFPYHFQKEMFLCPMTKADKERYIKTAYKIRVGLNLLLFIIINSIFFAKGIIRADKVLLMFVSYTLFSATMNYSLQGNINELCKKEEKLGARYEGITGYGVLMLVTAVVNIVSYMFLFISLSFQDVYLKVLIVILLVAQVILYLVLRLRYERVLIKIGCSYEDNY